MRNILILLLVLLATQARGQSTVCCECDDGSRAIILKDNDPDFATCAAACAASPLTGMNPVFTGTSVQCPRGIIMRFDVGGCDVAPECVGSVCCDCSNGRRASYSIQLPDPLAISDCDRACEEAANQGSTLIPTWTGSSLLCPKINPFRAVTGTCDQAPECQNGFCCSGQSVCVEPTHPLDDAVTACADAGQELPCGVGIPPGTNLLSPLAAPGSEDFNCLNDPYLGPPDVDGLYSCFEGECRAVGRAPPRPSTDPTDIPCCNRFVGKCCLYADTFTNFFISSGDLCSQRTAPGVQGLFYSNPLEPCPPTFTSTFIPPNMIVESPQDVALEAGLCCVHTPTQDGEDIQAKVLNFTNVGELQQCFQGTLGSDVTSGFVVQDVEHCVCDGQEPPPPPPIIFNGECCLCSNGTDELYIFSFDTCEETCNNTCNPGFTTATSLGTASRVDFMTCQDRLEDACVLQPPPPPPPPPSMTGTCCSCSSDGMFVGYLGIGESAGFLCTSFCQAASCAQGLPDVTGSSLGGRRIMLLNETTCGATIETTCPVAPPPPPSPPPPPMEPDPGFCCLCELESRQDIYIHIEDDPNEDCQSACEACDSDNLQAALFIEDENNMALPFFPGPNAMDTCNNVDLEQACTSAAAPPAPPPDNPQTEFPLGVPICCECENFRGSTFYITRNVSLEVAADPQERMDQCDIECDACGLVGVQEITEGVPFLGVGMLSERLQDACPSLWTCCECDMETLDPMNGDPPVTLTVYETHPGVVDCRQQCGFQSCSAFPSDFGTYTGEGVGSEALGFLGVSRNFIGGELVDECVAGPLEDVCMGFPPPPPPPGDLLCCALPDGNTCLDEPTCDLIGGAPCGVGLAGGSCGTLSKCEVKGQACEATPPRQQCCVYACLLELEAPPLQPLVGYLNIRPTDRGECGPLGVRANDECEALGCVPDTLTLVTDQPQTTYWERTLVTFTNEDDQLVTEVRYDRRTGPNDVRGVDTVVQIEPNVNETLTFCPPGFKHNPVEPTPDGPMIGDTGICSEVLGGIPTRPNTRFCECVPSGACCLEDQCIPDQTRGECVLMDGQFFEGLECVNGQCPSGACCRRETGNNAACVPNTPAAQCLSPDIYYPATDCFGTAPFFTCPFGTCCFPDDRCENSTTYEAVIPEVPTFNPETNLTEPAIIPFDQVCGDTVPILNCFPFGGSEYTIVTRDQGACQPPAPPPPPPMFECCFDTNTRTSSAVLVGTCTGILCEPGVTRAVPGLLDCSDQCAVMCCVNNGSPTCELSETCESGVFCEAGSGGCSMVTWMEPCRCLDCMVNDDCMVGECCVDDLCVTAGNACGKCPGDPGFEDPCTELECNVALPCLTVNGTNILDALEALDQN